MEGGNLDVHTVPTAPPVRGLEVAVGNGRSTPNFAFEPRSPLLGRSGAIIIVARSDTRALPGEAVGNIIDNSHWNEKWKS
jgi:hypothetical protein